MELLLILLLFALVGVLALVFRYIVRQQGLLERLHSELKAQREAMDFIFKESPVAIVYCDREGYLLNPSPSFLTLYKVALGELDRKKIWDFIDPDYIPAGKELFRQSVEEKKKVRDVLQTRNSLCEQLWSQVDILPYQDQFMIVLVNVNQSVRNQELLEKFQRGLDRVQILSITDRNGIINYVNDSFSRISGFEPDEIVGHSHALLKSGHHSKDFYEKMWTTLLSGKTWRGQFKNKNKFGGVYWTASTILPFTDESGTPIQFVAVSRDITAEKVAEENLMLSLEKIEFENRIWRVIDRVQTNMIVLREESDMIQILLQVVCEDLGWDYAQIYRKDLNAEAESVLWFEQCFAFDNFKQQSLETCLRSRELKIGEDLPGLSWQRQGPIWYQEVPIHFQGRRPLEKFGFRFQSAFCVPIFVNQMFYGVIELLSVENREKDEKVTRAMTVISSYFGKILDRRNQELREQEYKEQLAFSAKMSTLGEMASGIAHEINSPLAIVVGYAGQALRQIEIGAKIDNQQLKRTFERIIATSHRIAKIVKGLRSFARDGSADPFVTTPVRTIIEDTLSLCDSKIRAAEVKLKVEPFDETLTIDCRAVQVSQILINCINNSLDAMESFEKKWIRLEILDLAEYVEFRLVDAGTGIPESVVQKIMQPFFTTKPIGKGTGLGLSIARGIADAHSGAFGVHMNQPNTTFYLRLPKKQIQDQIQDPPFKAS